MNSMPCHALRFVGAAGKLAQQHGLRRGLVAAGKSANPAMMAFEAASSVLIAIQSFSKLEEARAIRSGLKREMEQLQERLETLRARLEAERETVALGVEQAQNRETHNAPIRDLLAAVARDAMYLVTSTLRGLNDASDEDLPDLTAIDRISRDLQSAQRQLVEALSAFQNPSSPPAV